MTERAGHQRFRCRCCGVILPAWVAELVHFPVEVIVAGPAPAAVAAKKATTSIPIVMTPKADPRAFGLDERLSGDPTSVHALWHASAQDRISRNADQGALWHHAGEDPRLCRRQCQSHSTKTCSSLAALLPEHSTPELLLLETTWAALVSYRVTAQLLQDVPPSDEVLHAFTICQHVYTVAQRPEQGLGEEQQWTQRGAHLLLQIRTRVLNGDWQATFREWYLGFRPLEQHAAA
jgi:hypothetical protein